MIVHARRYSDYYFTIPLWEIAALEHYHELVEISLPDLIESRGLPNWDGDAASSGRTAIAQLHQQVVDDMLPSVLRVPLLLSLWSIYEAALVEIADVMRTQKGINYSLLDRQSDVPQEAQKPWRNLLPRIKFFFERELGISLFVGPQVEQEIGELYRLRNALMHAGGRRGASKPQEWNKLIRWAERQEGVELFGGHVSLSCDYIRGRVDLVRRAVTHVITQARDELHRLGVR